MVDQCRCRRILKQVKQCVLLIFAFLRLNTTFSPFLMLKCIVRELMYSRGNFWKKASQWPSSV